MRGECRPTVAVGWAEVGVRVGLRKGFVDDVGNSMSRAEM